MSGKSQTIGDSTLSRLSQILPTNENSKSQISPIVWDGRGQIWRTGAFLFSRRVPDFCDGRRSSRQMKTQICTVGTSAMDFAHYQFPKLLGSSPPITNKHGVSRESGTDFWRLSDISAKSGIVGKKLNPRSSGIFPTYENQAQSLWCSGQVQQRRVEGAGFESY